MVRLRTTIFTVAALLVQYAGAHGGEPSQSEGGDMNMTMPPGSGEHGHGHGHGALSEADLPKPESEYPPTYFALAEHSGVLYAHIASMVMAWIFLLPVAVMLSLARSRYTLALQVVFTGVNVLGTILGISYNASTPDLYPNNAHHKVGWIAVSVVAAQVLISLLAHVAGRFRQCEGTRSSDEPRGEYRAFLPFTEASMASNDTGHATRFAPSGRLSQDSGQGTEPNTESLRSHSVTSSEEMSPRASLHAHKEREYDDHDDLEDTPASPLPFSSNTASLKRNRSALRRATGLISSRAWKGLMFLYDVVDRTILILGFIAFCLGIVAHGRFFEGRGIYSGLAHWVKGGIFFWLGIFNLGRWAGSFGELGWAWNVRPRRASGRWRPSAEFIESLLIFIYGSTNIFMEHMSATDNTWKAQDLEHVSITVLFIGGGLLGMLVESVKIRTLLNTTVDEAVEPEPEPASTHPFDRERNAYRNDTDEDDDDDVSSRCRQRPLHYEFSINPIPALVILLLGIMMSSHTQASMISSMVHKQWGNLLTGASFARGLTYVLMYLKPPTSVYPSRPPTELLTSFGLISGGIIFMASAKDTVSGMIHYQLDAMFMYTVTMGLVGVLMAWVITVLAVKGWAVRREGAVRGRGGRV